jgi:hypothetical protein
MRASAARAASTVRVLGRQRFDDGDGGDGAPHLPPRRRRPAGGAVGPAVRRHGQAAPRRGADRLGAHVRRPEPAARAEAAQRAVGVGRQAPHDDRARLARRRPQRLGREDRGRRRVPDRPDGDSPRVGQRPLERVRRGVAERVVEGHQRHRRLPLLRHDAPRPRSSACARRRATSSAQTWSPPVAAVEPEQHDARGLRHGAHALARGGRAAAHQGQHARRRSTRGRGPRRGAGRRRRRAPRPRAACRRRPRGRTPRRSARPRAPGAPRWRCRRSRTRSRPRATATTPSGLRHGRIARREHQGESDERAVRRSAGASGLRGGVTDGRGWAERRGCDA